MVIIFTPIVFVSVRTSQKTHYYNYSRHKKNKLQRYMGPGGSEKKKRWLENYVSYAIAVGEQKWKYFSLFFPRKMYGKQARNLWPFQKNWPTKATAE